MSRNSLIYDYETLSLDRDNCVILCLAALSFDEKRFAYADPYEWDELIDNSHFIKFDVTDQVKRYGRTIDKSTLKWWNNQRSDIQKILKPSIHDKPIEELYDFFKRVTPNPIHRIYTRGNTFDPIITDGIIELLEKDHVHNWHQIRDTRSMFEGMSYGVDIKNNFVPEEYKERFIPHDPIHDIVMDVIRFQQLARAVL